MATGPTPGMKALNKYLQQAKKLDRVEPLIAYYCRVYAMRLGMKVTSKSKDDMATLGAIMAWLEQHKDMAKGISKDDAKMRVENFALQVFQHADNEDRKATPTKATAVIFNDAYVFLEICKQFGELSSDVSEKSRYALFKVTDIFKALKEGREPVSGPPGGDEMGMGGEFGEDGETGGSGGGGGTAVSASPGGAPAASGGGGGFASPPGGSAAASFSGGAPRPTASFAGASPSASASFAAPSSLPIATAHAHPVASAFSFIDPSAGGPEPQHTTAAAAAAPGSYGHYETPAATSPSYDAYTPASHSSFAGPSGGSPPAPSGGGGGGGGGYAAHNDFPDFSPSAPHNTPAPVPTPKRAAPAPTPTPVAPKRAPMPAPAPFVPPPTATAYSYHGPPAHAGALVINPAPTALERTVAVVESERLLKHAQASLRFQDVPTAITKLQETLAILLHHNSKAP